MSQHNKFVHLSKAGKLHSAQHISKSFLSQDYREAKVLVLDLDQSAGQMKYCFASLTMYIL